MLCSTTVERCQEAVLPISAFKVAECMKQNCCLGFVLHRQLRWHFFRKGFNSCHTRLFVQPITIISLYLRSHLSLLSVFYCSSAVYLPHHIPASFPILSHIAILDCVFPFLGTCSVIQSNQQRNDRSVHYTRFPTSPLLFNLNHNISYSCLVFNSCCHITVPNMRRSYMRISFCFIFSVVIWGSGYMWDPSISTKIQMNYPVNFLGMFNTIN